MRGRTNRELPVPVLVPVPSDPRIILLITLLLAMDPGGGTTYPSLPDVGIYMPIGHRSYIYPSN
jgi:hypothetical protein